MVTLVQCLVIIQMITLISGAGLSDVIPTNSDSVEDFGKRSNRVKRYLRFRPNSKCFYRLNIKVVIMPQHIFFAHAYGFRANYLLPDRNKKHRMRRNDLYADIEQLINNHGFDGRACVLKTLCEASRIITPQSNILLKIFRLIFTLPEGDEKTYPYLKSEQCDELEHHCPLSLLQMTSYYDEE